jgi:hypothetical protein
MGRAERYVFQRHHSSAWAVVGIICRKQKWFRARGHGLHLWHSAAMTHSNSSISRRRQDYARNDYDVETVSSILTRFRTVGRFINH